MYLVSPTQRLGCFPFNAPAEISFSNSWLHISVFILKTNIFFCRRTKQKKPFSNVIYMTLKCFKCKIKD